MKYLALVFSLFFASPAWSAFVLIDSTKVGNQDTSGFSNPPEVTPAIDTTGADFLVCIQSHYGDEGGYGGAVTDSKSNTWTQLTNNETDATIRIYYATNTAGKVGAGHTFSTGAFFASLICAAFSGAHTTVPLDQERADAYTPYSAALNDLATGSITPTENNELVIAGWSTSEVNGSVSTVNGGFTVLEQQDMVISPFRAIGSFAAYLIQTTATAANPTGSWTGVMSVGAVIASFKVAPVGAPARRPIAPIIMQ